MGLVMLVGETGSAEAATADYTQERVTRVAAAMAMAARGVTWAAAEAMMLGEAEEVTAGSTSGRAHTHSVTGCRSSRGRNRSKKRRMLPQDKAQSLRRAR